MLSKEYLDTARTILRAAQTMTDQHENRVTGAEAHAEFRENITTSRYTPEVGAVCPNWARTDLCGGREVTRVPTAKVIGRRSK